MRILQAAHQLFDARGYRSVTISDLADKLGMSKKTIYQYFSSKEEIATAVVEEVMSKLDQVINMPELPKDDPLFVIKKILTHVKDETMRFGPLFLMDIEKYLPELAHKYRQFRNGKKKAVQEILKDAQQMGLIRDIPIQLATEILSVCLKALVKSEFFSQHGYSISDVTDIYLDIFCNGIAAPSASGEASK
jgi:AcrR family transcriptional regulator